MQNKISQAQLNSAARILIPVCALAMLLPSFTPPMGLLLGAFLGLCLGNPYAPITKEYSRKLMGISIVGIGASMNLFVVAKAGLQGIGYTMLGITVAFILGIFGGRFLKVSRNIGILLSAGTAICGGSAIAAVSPVIKAKDEEISVALATVFLLNAVALIIFPPIGHYFGLSETQFGLWSGLAIHDTSSVVGAASRYGSEALAIGTTVKLARALWIFPVTVVIALLTAKPEERNLKKARPPLFIYGFILAAAVVTFIPELRPAGQIAANIARQLLVLTLFMIGCGLTRPALKAVGARALFLGLSIWIIISVSTLVAIVKNLIHFS